MSEVEPAANPAPRKSGALRKALLACPFVLFGLVLAILIARALVPTPDLSGSPRAAPWASRPIVAMPARDVAAGNGLACAFVHADGDELVVSLVWKDEDHPWVLIDQAYDLIRLGLYGRVMDVETYRWGPDDCVFERVYAGSQGFGTSRHLSATIPVAEFERRGERPVIYVRTWNHMLDKAPGPEPMSWVYLDDYPIYAGDRAACEAAFGD